MAERRDDPPDSGPDWENTYAAKLPLYGRLKEEVIFALTDRLAAEGVKTHSIIGRVKERDSLREKGERKNYTNPIEQATDVVGVRVVTLFLSDLPRVKDAVHDLFDVLDEDDTVAGEDPNYFGYMSVHYAARLSDAQVGPRYDSLKGVSFEVQVRTVVMDAWANVSHYLAYKGTSSIPTELRKDFNALSGLFYVADQHFELFFAEAMKTRRAAEQQLSEDSEEPIEINLESLGAYLQRRFPDRRHLTSRDAISVLVEDLDQVGYNDIHRLDSAITDAEDALRRYEEDLPPGGDKTERFADVGAVRIALAIADPAYDEYEYPNDDDQAPYRKYLKSR